MKGVGRVRGAAGPRAKSGDAAELGLPPGLLAELDALVERPTNTKRWTPAADGLVMRYDRKDVPVKTLCAVLTKAFPDKTWPYTVVNARRRYLRSRGAL